jgi:Holliday junction DNA helicase RuvA
MIARMSGVVAEVTETAAVIDRDGIGYEVLVPGYALGELAACRGRDVTLHTLEFFEGNAAGGNLVPRLIGFLHATDREFFTRFISVKGIGIRKGLRALGEPVASVAAAIEQGDAAWLGRLPGIGKRAAQTIIAELKGKVEDFALGVAAGAVSGEAQQQDWNEHQRLALRILTEWGDSRADAERWVERAGQLHPDLDSAEKLVEAAYRVKTGVEG